MYTYTYTRAPANNTFCFFSACSAQRFCYSILNRIQLSFKMYFYSITNSYIK